MFESRARGSLRVNREKSRRALGISAGMLWERRHSRRRRVSCWRSAGVGRLRLYLDELLAAHHRPRHQRSRCVSDEDHAALHPRGQNCSVHHHPPLRPGGRVDQSTENLVAVFPSQPLPESFPRRLLPITDPDTRSSCLPPTPARPLPASFSPRPQPARASASVAQGVSPSHSQDLGSLAQVAPQRVELERNRLCSLLYVETPLSPRLPQLEDLRLR